MSTVHTCSRLRNSMGNVIVIGAQWGDEGKGKIVDLLCGQADMVVRYQGGPNAGHTITTGGHRTLLHHIPSGILHPDCLCLMGNGMVVDPERLLAEIEELREAGIEVDGRLFLSHRAHLIFPHHHTLDAAMEEEGRYRIGTTRRGVGLAYQSKAARIGIRPADLATEPELRRRLSLGLQLHAAWRAVFSSAPSFTLEDLLQWAGDCRRRLEPYVDDTVERLHRAVDQGKRILFEGSQGTLLDVDHGTYPYVTSSNTTAGAVCAGAGIGPQWIHGVVGVFKAYATRVGEGPLPTEEKGESGETLRRRGREFGTTTGRARRCGWFDVVAARYAVRLNGLSLAALTLLDVLDEFEEIRLAVAYDTGSGTITQMPAAHTDLQKARPIYETLPGWRTDVTSCRRWDDLPAPARALVERLESLLGVSFLILSVGPGREQTIIRDRKVFETLFD
ncbi:MAG: adenylosuccinate synthase [Acidobacteriota bacterium]